MTRLEEVLGVKPGKVCANAVDANRTGAAMTLIRLCMLVSWVLVMSILIYIAISLIMTEYRWQGE